MTMLDDCLEILPQILTFNFVGPSMRECIAGFVCKLLHFGLVYSAYWQRASTGVVDCGKDLSMQTSLQPV